MQPLDFNLLQALDVLLQEGSVVGAAARLHLSAPAMSRTLGRIRDATGDPIMVRAGRGLVATPRALALRERVHAAVTEARALLAPETPTDPRRFERTFTLRVDDAVTAVLGPPLLTELARHAPGVTVVFQAEGSEDVASLRNGTVDLDIGVQGPLGPEVRVRKLMEDQRVVLVRGMKPSRRKAMTLQQYAAAMHVDASRRGRTRGPVDDVLQQHGLARRVGAVVPNQLAAAILVAQTDMVSLVSKVFARAIASTLAVHALPPPAQLGSVSITLAWHPRWDADPVHSWLRQQLYSIAQDVQRHPRP